MLQRFAVTLGVALAAVGGTVGAVGQAAPQSEARFEFTASRIGAGPGHGGGSIGAPLRQLRGSFTISYPSARVSDARVTSLKVVGVTNPGARGWRQPITTGTSSVTLHQGGPPWLPRGQIMRIAGPSCQPTPCASRDAFSVSFVLPSGPLAVGQLRFRAAHYTVSGDREVYRARAGTVRVTHVETG